MKRLFYLLCLLWLSSCQKEEMIDLIFIEISVDKLVALEQGDEIIITASGLNSDLQAIENLALEYYANDILLPDNIFRPTERGTYQLSARYKDLESKKVEVQVVNLDLDLEELILNYDGNQLLTNTDWSYSGNFSYSGRIGESYFDLDLAGLELTLDGAIKDQLGQFHFDEAGTYEFQGQFKALKSNTIAIQVRADTVYPTLTLPVVFHAYGIDVNQNDILNLIDTLNGAFSTQRYSKTEVLEGRVNPNAVNCYIEFELVTSAPLDRKLSSTGLNIIKTENDEYPPLSLQAFTELEEKEGWNPEEYVNIWLAPAYEFEFPPVNISDRFLGNARGLAYSPYLEGASLEGLATIGQNNRFPDVNTLSQSILLRSGSVLGAHPDYIVASMGYFLGLFVTSATSCELEGDYCKDTFTWDPDKGFGPQNEFISCNDQIFIDSNHMAVGRKYKDFTYDQRERMRLVLKHALFRPGE